jgi:aspartate kinase
MSVVVAKFGGTSLAGPQQFEQVKKIVTADKNRRYIIPSAPGKRFDGDVKITDLLYQLYDSADNPPVFEARYNSIFERFVELRDTLGLGVEIERYLDRIKEDILSGASRDYAASRGEYLSGLLLSDYLGYEFIDPKDVLFFDHNGRFEPEKTKTVMRGRLKSSPSAVIPGFYGSMPSGAIKTFSRGGSDITGAIVARAASAKLYENWTDVNGFLMADPRIVPDAKIIKTITYRELRELSYMGATVLHEDSIFPVFKAGIPINIKNTNDPGEPGTMIVPDVDDFNDNGYITGIAGRKNFTVIAIEKNSMNNEIGFGRRVLSAIEKNGLNFEHMPSGIDTLSIVIADAQIKEKLQQLVDDIYTECQPDSIEIFENLALIATVGRGMIKHIGIAAKLFAALAEKGINIRMIDQGSSELNIIVGVETSDFERSIQAIYGAFC